MAKHEYKIRYEATTGTEFHSCSCGDFFDSFRITEMSVQTAVRYREYSVSRFSEHVEAAFRDAHCIEHPLVHVGIEPSSELTSSDTLSDDALVMVIDPSSQHFMKEGRLKVDGADWSVVDIGYAQPIPIESWKLMESGRAQRIIREAAMREFSAYVGRRG